MQKLVANILTDPSTITANSDFFLGGGSLLDTSCYLIRKQMGANVAAPDVFTNWTIEIIASLVWAKIKARG